MPANIHVSTRHGHRSPQAAAPGRSGPMCQVAHSRPSARPAARQPYRASRRGVAKPAPAELLEEARGQPEGEGEAHHHRRVDGGEAHRPRQRVVAGQDPRQVRRRGQAQAAQHDQEGERVEQQGGGVPARGDAPAGEAGQQVAVAGRAVQHPGEDQARGRGAGGLGQEQPQQRRAAGDAERPRHEGHPAPRDGEREGVVDQHRVPPDERPGRRGRGDGACGPDNSADGGATVGRSAVSVGLMPILPFTPPASGAAAARGARCWPRPPLRRPSRTRRPGRGTRSRRRRLPAPAGARRKSVLAMRLVCISAATSRLPVRS